MYQFITDESNKILNYVPTTYKLITAEVERPQLPENPKPGVDYVEYYNPETKKIELKEEPRPLTQEEQIAKAQQDAEAAMKRAQAALQGVEALTGLIDAPEEGGV